jgi:hypothetical protein
MVSLYFGFNRDSDIKVSPFYQISPPPSFSKRGNSSLCQREVKRDFIALRDPETSLTSVSPWFRVTNMNFL